MGAASRQAAQDLFEQHECLSVRTSLNSAVKDDRLRGPLQARGRLQYVLRLDSFATLHIWVRQRFASQHAISPARGERGQLFPAAHRRLRHQQFPADTVQALHAGPLAHPRTRPLQVTFWQKMADFFPRALTLRLTRASICAGRAEMPRCPGPTALGPSRPSRILGSRWKLCAATTCL